MAVVACDIDKELGGRTVLQGVGLRIDKGKITVLTGPSGSGKTSLIRAVSLLDPPTKGVVHIDNITYRFPGDGLVSPKPWPKLTVVFQQLFLWPHLSLRQNIELPLKRLWSTQVSKLVESLLDEFEIRECVDRFPNEVSNGQRQRAAIVRALALKPSYILFDEITSALDVEQINNVHRHLNELKQGGIGVLLVTHMLDFAERSADSVVFIDEGKVVESGGAGIIRDPQTDRLKRFVSVGDRGAVG